MAYAKWGWENSDVFLFGGVAMAADSPSPEQVKGSIRRQFGYLLDHRLTDEELTFLSQTGDVAFKVFHVLVNGMKDLCSSCISIMGLMTEKEDLTDDEQQQAISSCECGQVADVIGIAEAPL